MILNKVASINKWITENIVEISKRVRIGKMNIGGKVAEGTKTTDFHLGIGNWKGYAEGHK